MSKTKRTLPGPEKAPYCNGDLREYVASWDKDIEWRDNVPFYAALALTGMERGRSAMRYIWTDEDGNTYPMFAVDAYALMQSIAGVDSGAAFGHWIVMKRGQNYGIARYEG